MTATVKSGEYRLSSLPLEFDAGASAVADFLKVMLVYARCSPVAGGLAPSSV